MRWTVQACQRINEAVGLEGRREEGRRGGRVERRKGQIGRTNANLSNKKVYASPTR